MGILTEHYAGRFPAWLAPVQAKVLLVSEKCRDYADSLCRTLDENGIRWEMDTRNEKIGYMIREAQFVQRIPYLLIVGQREAEEDMVSVRYRDSSETETVSLEKLMEILSENR